jgi:hypothetical protein
LFRDLDGVRELRSGVAPKVADATGVFINGLGQFFWCKPLFVPNPFSMCPILAEKTIKRAPMVKHGKVFKSIFRPILMGISGISGPCSAGTDPIGYTIGWKPIIIPTDISLSY